MKELEIKTETSTVVKFGGKEIYDVFKDICDSSHGALEESTRHSEECETLYEDNQFKKCYDLMESRVSLLESTLCHILDLIGD